ncbi:MAG: glycosyltransferase [Candidatus Pacebacteria bacterium]|nr:glycosyltransferase [Candidatus Paceibacterota bacterium]
MIVILQHSLNPYKTELFNAMAKAGMSIKVYYLAQPAQNRRWQQKDFQLNFPHLFLKGFKIYFPGVHHNYFHFSKGLWQQLKKDQPTKIITISWNHSATFQAWFYAKLNKTPFWLWSQSTSYETSWQRTLTKPLIKFLVKSVDGLIAGGTRAKDYLIELGATPKKILVSYNTVDNDFFINQAKKQAQKQRKTLRKKFRLSNQDRLVLYVGRFSLEKGIFPLLELAKQFKNKQHLHWLLIGYGPLEAQIKEFIKTHQLSQVNLLGFVANQELINYYATADVFLLPSWQENWGIVVNEAMCAAKPVLVSKYAGCSVDLVKDGVNGYVIDPADILDLKTKLIKLIKNQQQLVKSGQASLAIIKKFNYQNNIQVLKQI